MEVLKEKYAQDCQKLAKHLLHSETSGNLGKCVRKRKYAFSRAMFLVSSFMDQNPGKRQRLEVFQNRCLRKIPKIFWPNTISNAELHSRTSTQPITLEIKRRRWQWIGHVLRMPQTAIVRTTLRWTPDGKRVRGRPKETWRRTVEREMKQHNLTWGKLEKTSRDRLQWRALVSALCAIPHEEN